MVSANLVSNIICPDLSIKLNGSNQQNDVNLNTSCLSLYSGEEDESSNLVMSDEINHSSNEKTDESMQQYFLPIKFPSNVKEWSLLFKNMIDLASIDLPKAADQINRLLQLYTEIDNVSSVTFYIYNIVINCSFMFLVFLLSLLNYLPKLCIQWLYIYIIIPNNRKRYGLYIKDQNLYLEYFPHI